MNLKQYIRRISDKLKNMSDKDKMINIAFIGILGILMVFLSRFFSNTALNEETLSNDVESVDLTEESVLESNTYKDYQEDLERDLEVILNQIEGVGDVDVMITFNTLEQREIAYNKKESNSVTSERDDQGGERVVEEYDSDQSAIMVSNNGEDQPVVVTENYPQVKGVIVVAEGASNPDVKYNLMKGIEYALDIPSYKIMIYQKKK